MKERGIIFSAPMVRALLEGRKSQTRRIVKLPKSACIVEEDLADMTEYYVKCGHCPYGQPGDRLWVRENWVYRGSEAHLGGGKDPSAAAWVKYPADGIERTIPRPFHDNSGVPSQRRQREGESDWDYNEYIQRWFHACRPSIHMPRWASRINLEVTGVRVEKLQDISQDDAKAEGPTRANAGDFGLETSKSAFRRLWDSIHGEAAWDLNPWLWVISFKRIPTPGQEGKA